MKFPLLPKKKIDSRRYNRYVTPVKPILENCPELKSRGDRPLKLTFEDQLNALLYFHLYEHESGRELIQDLSENEFAKQCIAPEGGISRSSFSEAVNNRGLEQLQFVFKELTKRAGRILPKEFSKFGELIAIDGSLIDACLSMYWADYRKGSKKAKGHFGFSINQGIPTQIFLTDGKGAERPFVRTILSPGQTGVMDRGYQCHDDFDLLQEEGKRFVCRIKSLTTRTVLEKYQTAEDDFVFYDAKVLLGTAGINQTKKPVRVVGYNIDGKEYYVATDRFDLTAHQVAEVYKLRWTIESFFKWWKNHLKVYHLIARSEYGLMVQILAGLISYLLMAIYCHEEYGEKVSIKRIRELRTTIFNELCAIPDSKEYVRKKAKKNKKRRAKT
ncbi:IS4 family transposase [Desulfoluna spongiiphila]|uniref:IS4 family transposase n=1 Tax=Desulfoluna spongiiphila TaxID=419481 RepID=UPI0012539478|nr:IS4 family transposase [Desulfoluna spongiiphila]VVS91966.1 ribonuclease h-like superfamily [Desulfoluna spongiiphila]VVS93642.1 ribonuclease h-like superfamily [Desulfoluna spongiiphila]